MNKNTYSKRFLKKKPKPNIRTIEEYIKAKKRFSSANFTLIDKHQIESTIEGYIIINNCKIPIRNNALLLNQWISRHKERLIKPQTKEQKALSRKISQKRYREKQLALKKNLIKIEDKPNRELTSLNMPTIFRNFNVEKQHTDKPKRLITAKRLSNTQKEIVYYGKYRIKAGANIPIQQLLKKTNWLIEKGKDKGNRLISKKKNALDETWKEFFIKSTASKKALYPYLDIVQKHRDAKKPTV